MRATDVSAKNLSRETGLTTSQLLVLQLLESGAEMTIGELARQVNLSQATVTVIADRLGDRGLVKRIKGEQDKRNVFVAVTERGAETLAQAPKILQATFLENFARLAEWEQAYVIGALERVAHLMNASLIDASPVLDVGAIDGIAEKQKARGAP